ncbi:MAG TPA: prepilin-type N-terminal cleavage/methylation domain-containing protein [Tepidisphaeraceae bacterium]|nr:prepilin-type N-terminal cleavage/methylation domain-containing protein [Tepidisphaeraceae bacterium]
MYRATPAQSQPAFTLVELLVVIGLIGLLIALLLPALAGARRASKQLACLSNLRQWGAGVQLYAIANHGYLPRRGQGVQPTNQITRPEDWFNSIPLLLHKSQFMDLVAGGTLPRPGSAWSIWLCPEALDAGYQYYWSYGMNMALSVEEGNQNNGMPDKITGVGNAATMVLFADAPGNYCSVFPSLTPGGYNPVARHNGRVNICFLDSHAASFLPADVGINTGVALRDDIRWHPPNSTWNSAH